MVRAGSGAARPPSMADVAVRAGVSHQTVSRVLNDHPLVRPATRDKVLAAIEELGYRRNSAARALVTNRSGRVGMVSAHLALHGPSMIAAAVQDAAHEAGYDVGLVGLPEFSAASLRGAVDRLLDQAVEAVVVAVAHRDALETVRSVRLPVPLVLVQGVEAGQPMAAGIDQRAGGALATRHLLGHGHVTVAHVAGPSDWTEAGQRRDGWLAALAEADAEPGPEIAGDWSAASGYEAGRRLAADRGVRAVFVANDSMAIGVLRALHEAGRGVPGDVHVVGYDDIPEAAYVWPPMTCVRQDFAALGRSAVELTLRALGGEADPVVDLVVPDLAERASCGH